MNCRRARKQIYDFIDGILADKDRLSLEEHLNQCKSCEAMNDNLTRSLNLLHSLPPEQPDPNFTWKVRLGVSRASQQLTDTQESVGSWARVWNLRFATSALASFVVVVGAAFMFSSFQQNSGTSPQLSTPVASNEVKTIPQKTSNFAESEMPKESAKQPDVARRDQPNQDRLMLPQSRVGANVVSTGGGASKSSAGPAAIEEVREPINTDSLLTVFLSNRVTNQRERLLKEQVELIQQKLRECETDSE